MSINKLRIKKLAFTLLSFLLVVVIITLKLDSTQAQQGLNIDLSPGKSNLTIDPGEEFIQTFRIGNYSGVKKTLYIYMQDFTVSNEEGTPTFFESDTSEEEGRKFALSHWVELPSESIELEHEEVKEVDAVIKVPEDAEAGGHYGAFFVQSESPERTGTAIGSVGRIASLMLVNVPGDVTEEIVFTQVFTNKKIYWEDDPNIEFVTYLKNEGNVHGIPLGAFNVTGGYGSKTNKSIIYNQEQGAVIPGAPERKIAQKFSLDQEGLIPPIGKFTIDLVARYGTENLPLETTIFFWLLPAKFIAIAALATVLSVFILWRVLLSFKK